MKMHTFLKKKARMFCQFKKSFYLCNRKREKHSPKACQAKARRQSRLGPFVYRLGRKIFILERGVRFPHGLQIKIIKNKIKD
jgi:hypothetical protein